MSGTFSGRANLNFDLLTTFFPRQEGSHHALFAAVSGAPPSGAPCRGYSQPGHIACSSSTSFAWLPTGHEIDGYSECAPLRVQESQPDPVPHASPTSGLFLLCMRTPCCAQSRSLCGREVRGWNAIAGQYVGPAPDIGRSRPMRTSGHSFWWA